MADRTWTADDVADHFEEAFRTLRKLPPVRVQGYFNAWPQLVRTEKGHQKSASRDEESGRWQYCILGARLGQLVSIQGRGSLLELERVAPLPKENQLAATQVTQAHTHTCTRTHAHAHAHAHKNIHMLKT